MLGHLFIICGKAIVEALCQLALTAFGVQVILFGGRRNKAQFGEHRGHRGFTKYEEARLLYALVLTPSVRSVLLLDAARQVYALLHITVLHELKDNVTLGAVRVETGIGFGIVLFVCDYGVFTLRHLKVFFSAGNTKGESLRTIHLLATRHSVGVNRHEEVGIIAVGNRRTLLERHKLIRAARINHLHLGALLLDQLTKGQRHIEVNRLLLRLLTHGSGILTAMTGINNQGELLLSKGREGKCHNKREAKRQKGDDLFKHKSCKVTPFFWKLSTGDAKSFNEAHTLNRLHPPRRKKR